MNSHKTKTPYLEQFTEKQLKEDFQVFEYLRNNKQNNENIENYIKFYNQILLKKNEKLRKYEQLQDNYKRTNKVEQGHIPQEIVVKKIDEQDLEQINFRSTQELEVRETLEREIIEYKKSLGLLKGDIGHIIKRNQSEKLLESKITKVKIVADDQYSKVYNQYAKDKQQNKVLTEMQKAFNQRLKNVELFENKSLSRTEDTFLQLMGKQKKMNEKLTNIERSGALVEEYVELKKQKNHNNYNTQYISKLINSLSQILNCQESNYIIHYDSKTGTVQDMNFANTKLASYRDNLMETLNEFQKQKSHFEKDPKINQMTEQICSDIISKYDCLIGKLESLSRLYSENLVKVKNLNLLLQGKEEQNVSQDKENDTIPESEVIKTKQEIKEYHNKIKRNLKIVFLCLNFFKIISETEKCMLMEEIIQEIGSKLQNQTEQQYFYEFLPYRYENTLKQIIGNYRDKMSNNRHNIKKYQKYTYDQVVEQKQQTQQLILRRTKSRSRSKMLSRVIEIETQLEEFKAKRIKFLETIDQDYYKILKQTLQMEKDHTRKNYEFLRRFKRQKYVNRDSVLKQKRFQASFSILWSQNQKQSSLNKTLKHRLSMSGASTFYKSWKTKCDTTPEKQSPKKLTKSTHFQSQSAFKRRYETILQVINKK